MTIPERIMEEARAVFNERDVLGSIARAIQAAEERGAASSQQAEPVALVVSKFGDPEAFGEREIEFNPKSLQKIPYGTPLYASPSPASDSTRVIDMAVAWRNARLAVSSLSVSDPVYREKFNTLANAEDALNSAIREIYEMVVADQQSALAASDSTRVAVKPLEWYTEDDGTHRANSPIGMYIVWPGKGFSYDLSGPVGGLLSAHKRLEVAKSAAQADYERRILSALQFTDQKGDGHE